MKKSLVVACLISICAVSGFAQSTSAATPAQAGAKLVAERDAAWRKAHPGGATIKAPKAMHPSKRVTHVKHLKRMKHPMHKVKTTG